MIKAMIFLKRRPDISEAEFVEHYEGIHVPLIRRLFPEIKDYTRNYLNRKESSPTQHASVVQPGNIPELPFDVVTEVWFENRPAYDLFVKKINDPQIVGVVAADEAKFLERSTMQLLLVTERRSSHEEGGKVD